MKVISVEDVRSLVFEKLRPWLDAKGLRAQEIPDNFDLLTEGLIDSMGILQLIAEEVVGDTENVAVVVPINHDHRQIEAALFLQRVEVIGV